MIIDEEIISKIRILVKKFKDEKAWMRSEEHIQTYFTRTLLEILGWESTYVRINQGQEVKTGKKPDILLQDSGNTLLVVESKDASKKDMLDGRYQNITFVEQLYGYCRAEGIFWGVLTNFVEWRVYSIYQDRLYKNKKYAFHDILWQNTNPKEYINLLSNKGVEFFKQLERSTVVRKKGRWNDDPVYYPKQEEIKEKFFQDLKRWRGNLRNYLNKNYERSYGLETIDLMTQKILDRLIFIDYCADNGIITQDRLHAILQSKGNLHNELKKIFIDLDEKFNSELFAPNECDSIELDDNIIRPIIAELADTDFKKLSVHVIGEVYENYLGELLKAGKRGVKFDELKSAQKKKSQGIYYTPDFIVNYIVENTVGIVLNKCKTIDEIKNIRVLDPACGSGSFLIRIFDEFLKHYRRIQHNPLLEFAVRKQILQNNIYGVDLDERAVEITKLNLLVKALEESAYFSHSGRKLLPNLKLNIRSGNSLISGEKMQNEMGLFWNENKQEIDDLKILREKFYSEKEDGKQADHFKNIQILEEIVNSKLNIGLSIYFKNLDVVKPFNYSVAFPEVFQNGGFDCIIGNPPYIDSERMTKEQPECRSFISDFYKFAKGNWDIYIAFLEHAYRSTNKNGLWSYITPDKWIAKPFGEALRKETLKNMCELLNVGRNVFSDAKVDSIVSIYSKEKTRNLKIYNYSLETLTLINDIKKTIIKQPYGLDFLFSKNLSILIKIESATSGKQFKFICENACATSDAYKLKPYIHDLGEREFHEDKYYKIINTGTVGRYVSRWGIKKMKYLQEDYLFPVIDRNEFEKEFANSYGKKANKPKIIIKGLTLLNACLDINGNIVPGKSTLIVFAENLKELKFLSAILNSKTAFFYISEKYPASSYNQGINFTKDMINTLPVPNPSRDIMDKIIIHVDKMTLVQRGLYLEKNSDKFEKINISLQAIDKEIDKLVYELYELTHEEIEIIESIK